MTSPKSNAVLAENIKTIQVDIYDIKMKLDTKYVSHETFGLTIGNLTKRMEIQERDVGAKFNFALKVAFALGVPIYGAVITLLFKTFVG